MDKFQETVQIIQDQLLSDITELVIKENVINHNHQPVAGIVDGCAYCKLYGNIFENEHTLARFDYSELKSILFSFQ